jgi:hypothetical protein
MSQQSNSELIRELRRIRYALLITALALASISFIFGMHLWMQSLPSSAPYTMELRNIQSELQALRGELANHRTAPIFAPKPGPVKGN